MAKRLTAYVSGKIQKTGYRARVVDYARVLNLKGTVENLDNGRVRIVAEGDDDRPNLFERAIDIKNTLIQVSSVESEYSSAIGDIPKFYKLVEEDGTDTELDTINELLEDLIDAVNNMNEHTSSVKRSIIV